MERERERERGRGWWYCLVVMKVKVGTDSVIGDGQCDCGGLACLRWDGV